MDEAETDIDRTTTSMRARRHAARVLAAITIALAALCLAVWIAPRASGAAAGWMRAPAVRLHTLRVPGGDKLHVDAPGMRGAAAPVTLDAGMQFTMAAVICDVPPAGAIDIRLRTSADGGAWGSWYEAPLEVVDERGVAQAFTDPIWTGIGRYVQVSASRGGGHGPATLSGVRLVAIDPTGDASVAARVTGTIRKLAATVAGIGVTQPADAASSAPVIVTRAAWGADEKLRSGSPSYAGVRMAFVHHTASGNDYAPADAPGIVRAIYAYHTKSLGWSDIGYNFLVDRFGAIYEGRYGGVTRGVIGAQAGGFNTHSTGISVLGTFTDEAPPAVTVNALERLLAWKLSLGGLDARGTAQLTCGLNDKYKLGAAVTFPVIAGHREANYTECPGDAFYALLPQIRANVARRMGSAVSASLGASNTLISPNGDGVLDATDLDVGITTVADWVLAVKNQAGQTVASWNGESAAASVTWDGTSGGSGVADGVYTAELAATPAGGDATTATAQITVDTTAPRLANAAVSPSSFSPNGDGQTETTSVAYSPAEACSVRVGILDTDGAVVRWLHGWRARKVRSYSVTWDGRVSSGGGLVAAPEGLYRFDVERRDAAGNIARQGIKVTLDKTLAQPRATPVTISPDGNGVRDATKLGFTLTHRATVTVRILAGDEVVRTLALGYLDPGVRSATWDGRDDSGEYVASSRPTFTVTAVSANGESSVRKGLVVDLYRPRLYAAKGKATRRGVAVKLGFKATDPYSAKVDVRYTITDARGRRVASGHPGWRRVSTALSIKWKPASRGVYTVTYRAVDLGRNREASRAHTTVRVR